MINLKLDEVQAYFLNTLLEDVLNNPNYNGIFCTLDENDKYTYDENFVLEIKLILLRLEKLREVERA